MKYYLRQLPATNRWLMLVFLNANRNNPQAHGITIVALYLKVFRVSYFPQGTEVFF